MSFTFSFYSIYSPFFILSPVLIPCTLPPSLISHSPLTSPQPPSLLSLSLSPSNFYLLLGSFIPIFLCLLEIQKVQMLLRSKDNKISLHLLRAAVCICVILATKVTTCTTIKRKNFRDARRETGISNIMRVALLRTPGNVGMFTSCDL